MYIDYLPLLLVNVVAGLTLIAGWMFLDAGMPLERRWVPGLLMAGLLGLAAGLHMVFTWPLPGSGNVLYGEMSVFFGLLLLGLGFVLVFGLDPLPVALYGAFAGVAAILVGVQVFKLGPVPNPQLVGAGFVWMGLLGLGAVPMLRAHGVPAVRLFGTLALLVAAVIWAVVAYTAYWHHVQPATHWQPPQMQQPMQKPPR